MCSRERISGPMLPKPSHRSCSETIHDWWWGKYWAEAKHPPALGLLQPKGFRHCGSVKRTAASYLLLPSLSPHLEHCASNNKVLLGKRDLIAADTPREGDRLSSRSNLQPFPFLLPLLILFLSSKFLFPFSARSQQQVTNQKCMKERKDVLFYFFKHFLTSV